MQKILAAPAVLAWILVITGAAFGQEVHLKTRTISTSTQTTAAQARPSGNLQNVHRIVEFDHTPGTADVEALMIAGAQVTAVLPDNAVMVSVPGELVSRPDGTLWVGPLEAQDKISPALSAKQKLSGAAAGRQLVIVEFHSDVDTAHQNALSTSSLSFQRPTGLLPRHVIVEASRSELNTLAKHDEIAYIFPADPELVNGAGIYSCAGMLTTSGTVPQYANITHGWDLGSDNIAHLTYFFGSLTPKVPAASAQSEILRAFSTWSNIVNVSFTPTTMASVARSVYIEFASGSHGDSYPFSVNGAMLAHTFYPVPINAETIAGDMHFNADEPWAIGADTDIYTVALHEIGHALGLSHTDNPGDVMYPYYHRGLPLSANDIGAVRELYQPAVTQTTTVTPPATPAPVTPSPTPAPATSLALTLDAVPSTTQTALENVTGIVTGGTAPYKIQWQTNHGSTGTTVVSTGSDMWLACDIPLVAGSNTITVTAFDSASHVSSGTATTTLQVPATTAPAVPIGVSISAPATAVITVTTPTISVSGTASGGAGITQVTWQTSNGATGIATGISPWVATGIPVYQGTTSIVIHAYDAKGASNWVALVAVHP